MFTPSMFQVWVVLTLCSPHCHFKTDQTELMELPMEVLGGWGSGGWCLPTHRMVGDLMFPNQRELLFFFLAGFPSAVWWINLRPFWLLCGVRCCKCHSIKAPWLHEEWGFLLLCGDWRADGDESIHALWVALRLCWDSWAVKTSHWICICCIFLSLILFF